MAIQLIQDHSQFVRRILKDQGLSYMKLASKAYLSIGTIKRFMKGDKISFASFEAICNALGIEIGDWETLIIRNGKDSLSTQSSHVLQSEDLKEIEEMKTHGGAISITGVFSQEKQKQIRVAIEGLKQLLIDSTVVITMDEDEEDISNQ